MTGSKATQVFTPKRVGIWLRVSTEDQVAGESPKHHEERARSYAEAKGWAVVDVYQLDAVSGKTVKEHPEAKRMLRDVERGHISGLIFSKLARLGRNTRELLEFSDFFDKHHADLISLQEAIDTSTPAGRFFYTVMAALAHWEREEIASRISASIPVRAKLGKSLGGPAPFGYQWKDGKLVPHPDDAPVRRLVHELFLEHKRVRTVARLLNEAGHRKKGKPFSPTGIVIMLRDPTPKGLHRANYMTWDPANKNWARKPESEWVYQAVEPILPTETWDACLVILQETHDSRKPPAKRPVQLFAGLLFCHCGEKMYVKSNTPKYVCLKCRNKIPITDLEEVFIEQLKDYILSPSELTGYLADKDQDFQAKQELLDAVIREEKNLRLEMDKVFRLYMDDQITAEGFGARHKPMEIRLAQLEDELPKLQAAVDFLKVNFLSREQILCEAHDLASFWPDMSREGKRRVIEVLVERITMGHDEIEINFCYLPTLHRPSSLISTTDDANGSSNPQAPNVSPKTVIADAFSKDMVNRPTAMAG